MPYLTVNDIQMYYEVHGQGEPLLLIHGLGGSHHDWEFQLEAFKSDYRIITPDLRGHGQSDKPEAPYSVSLFAKDIVELIKQLAPEGLHVVGHSLGGMIAFQLAVDYPQLVKTLTVVNSAPAVIFPGVKSQLLFYWRSFDIKLFGMTHLGKQLSKMLFPKDEQLELRTKFYDRWIQNSPDAYLNSLRVFRGWSVMHRIHGLAMPTLIITADHDYTPVSFKQMYSKFIPNAQLAIIDDSRHITIADQPELFNVALKNFLRTSN